MSTFFERLRSDRGENSVMQTITIAVSAILIAAGLATAPGLINNARDNNARGDLANLAYAQESILGDTGKYATTLGAIAEGRDNKVKLSGNNSVNVFAGPDCYAVFGLSQSGKTFYRTSASSQTFPLSGTWPAVKPSGYPANCAWPGSSEAATPPYATNLAFNPSFETTNGAQTAVRKNFARDPEHVNGSGWSSYFSPTVTNSTEDFHSAPTSRKIVTNATNQIGGIFLSQTSYLSGGEHYGTIWMKAPLGSEWTAALRVAVTGGGTNEGYGSHTEIGTGDWQQIKIQATLPDVEYSSIGLQVKQRSIRVGEVAYFDDAEILGNQGFGEFFSGDTANAGDMTYTWSGAKYNSTSLMSAPTIGSSAGVYTASYQTGATKGNGSHAIAVRRVATAPDAYTSLRFPDIGKANTVYTVAFTAWADKPTALSGRVSLQESSGNWKIISTSAPAGTIVGTEPARFVVTATSPSSLQQALHLTLRSGSAVGDVVYYDDLVIIEGESNGAYFDGNGFGNKWNGEANNSTSYGRPING